MVSSSQVPDNFKINWKQQNGSSPKARRCPHSLGSTAKLCAACDTCRSARVKCSGGTPCRRCESNQAACHYSVSMRKGRIKAKKDGAPAAVEQTSNRRSSTEPDSTTARVEVNVNDLLDGERSEVMLPAQRNENQYATAGSGDGADITPSAPLDPLLLTSTRVDAAGNTPSNFSGSDSFHTPLDMSLFNPPPELYSPEYTLPLPPGLDEADPLNLTLTPSSLFSLVAAGSENQPLCNCTGEQLRQLSTLYSTPRMVGIPGILSAGRSTAASINTQFSCLHCANSKCSTNFILAIIALQRVLNHFCGLSRRGHAYLAGCPPMTVGINLGTPAEFSLEPDEDRRVKRDLVLETLARLRKVIRMVSEAERVLQERAGGEHEVFPETKGDNLGWTRHSLGILERRLRHCVEFVSAPDWGLIPTGEAAEPDACT